jgi:F0F1-type ATP synthase gamma subunit
MSVKNVVKVMNFHSLIRVNAARRKVTEAYAYENELKTIISTIVNNRIFKEENLSIKMASGKKELNVYIGSDLGFCASFNADIISFLKEDDPKNDKIIIGKKINVINDNVLLFMNKEDFPNEYDKIFEIVLDGVLHKKYSSLNVIYIHYNNLNNQVVMKKKILPLEIDNSGIDVENDFSSEGDLLFIIWNLVSLYVTTEIKIAEAWSWASENVKRQAFTNESLKKIDEREEINTKRVRKENNIERFKTIVESINKRTMKKNKEE